MPIFGQAVCREKVRIPLSRHPADGLRGDLHCPGRPLRQAIRPWGGWEAHRADRAGDRLSVRVRPGLAAFRPRRVAEAAVIWRVPLYLHPPPWALPLYVLGLATGVTHEIRDSSSVT